jgi:hypothetical protein
MDTVLYNIKKEFQAILADAKGKPNTEHTRHQLVDKLNELFFRYQLNDLQWRISFNDNTVQIVPIRRIDELAFLPLLEEEQAMTHDISYTEHVNDAMDDYEFNLFKRWNEDSGSTNGKHFKDW